MKKPTKSRVKQILRKSGPTGFGKLVGLLRNAPGLSDLLNRMEELGEVSRDRSGRYLLPVDSHPRQSRSERVTGYVFRESRRWMLQPLGPASSHSISLDASDGLQLGDIVTAETYSQGINQVHGRVLKVIETSDEASRAALAMLRAYEVPHDDLQSPGKTVPRTVDADSMKGRRDLRKLPFVTIDGESARDFDDAVYAESIDRQHWRLMVAIADVAHYVRQGDQFDLEARKRGNSVYLPDRVVPMLPPQLSNGICSLNPNEDRLSVVCEMEISEEGRVESYEVYEAVIRSSARLTYTEVFQAKKSRLQGQSDSVNRSLNELFNVYRALRKARENRGALDFTSREATVHVSNGMPVDVKLQARNDAHCLIEECMICANVCAARFLNAREVAPLFRVHDGPDSVSQQELRQDLALLGLPDRRTRLSQSKSVQAMLNDIRSNSETPWIWEIQVLRSMAQAIYSLENSGHFGLALEEYVHFTSPIRRYADLHIHRLIKLILHGRVEEAKLKAVDRSLGSELSLCERRAVDVSRRVEAWLKCALLKRLVGKLFVGYIVKLEDFGVFVELDNYCISGLIHVSELHDDFYEHTGHELVGQSTGATYRIGDRLKVRLAHVDVELSRIDLLDASKSEVGHEFRQGKLSFSRRRTKRKRS